VIRARQAVDGAVQTSPPGVLGSIYPVNPVFL
jgi:hypothetical protein